MFVNDTLQGLISHLPSVWDLNTYKCAQSLAGEHGKAVFCVALDGYNVISGSHDSTIKQVSYMADVVPRAEND